MITLLGFPVKPAWIALLSAVMAFGSLCAAWIAQYVFDLAPCDLCLMQRWPYVVLIILSIIAYAVRESRVSYIVTILGMVVSYVVGTGIAAFHTGVERHWWKYASDCTTNVASADSIDGLREAILNAPTVRCDEIPWSFMGLSFANYNALFSAGMVLVMMYIAWATWDQRPR